MKTIIKRIALILLILMSIIFLGISHLLLYPNMKLIFGIMFMCFAIHIVQDLMGGLSIKK